MSLAIGGSNAPAMSTFGSLWVDVRDFGAKADNGVTDNSVPFQAAIDHAATMMQGITFSSAIVYIPGAPASYCVYHPVFLDQSNIEIRGDGNSTVIQMLGTKHPVFIAGIARIATTVVNGVSVPLTIGSSNRPDCFGKLDASVAPAPSTLWGIRTNSNSFVQFQGTPLHAGVGCAEGQIYSDNWGETTKLTVEFCLEPPSGQQFQPFTPILGLGGFGPVQASPFIVATTYNPNKFVMMFRTAEMDPFAARSFTFDLGSGTRPYRVAIQVDLANAVVSAFVNGVQVTLGDSNNITPTATLPFVPGSGLKFATNDHYPFFIGAFGVTGAYGQPTGVDLRLLRPGGSPTRSDTRTTESGRSRCGSTHRRQRSTTPGRTLVTTRTRLATLPGPTTPRPPAAS